MGCCRTNKRYFYRNQQTGESQWEYPNPDIVGVEAMDISTTPPPLIEEVPTESVPSKLCLPPVEPPPPPRIKSPEPPPPPIISKKNKPKKKITGKVHNTSSVTEENLLSLPLPPLPPENFNASKEPLPPGVSSESLSTEVTAKETLQSKEKDDLGSALNSFYCDLATLETNTVNCNNIEVPQHQEKVANTTKLSDVPVKKKKKVKVKLVQGLAMKKKGVSKLVEKWRKVQKDY